MAKGKHGLYLEAWKFGIYLGIPLMASWYYNDPERQRAAADYWKFIQYPANPNTNMREQLEDMRKQQESRKAYREQMVALQQQAQRSRQAAAVTNDSGDETINSTTGWRRWVPSFARRKEA